jgi:hypothetical protein
VSTPCIRCVMLGEARAGRWVFHGMPPKFVSAHPQGTAPANGLLGTSGDASNGPLRTLNDVVGELRGSPAYVRVCSVGAVSRTARSRRCRWHERAVRDAQRPQRTVRDTGRGMNGPFGTPANSPTTLLSVLNGPFEASPDVPKVPFATNAWRGAARRARVAGFACRAQQDPAAGFGGGGGLMEGRHQPAHRALTRTIRRHHRTKVMTGNQPTIGQRSNSYGAYSSAGISLDYSKHGGR